ncbi:polysaccharide deacetylase family protein [Streptomyces sp. WMMC500]|uniref:polysaccharide deacetylase family protein n=1 Tax=Streptomyces sp. WMMC500 TaxID=3015154 RepID=UPI00248AF6CD|nr:polysaccharide deacetylase family protein [Streptomyces sp. WMMC500]WBB63693.1 polysaccharide deacetylase family protein [Streptomyces sp. WMMC500]
MTPRPTLRSGLLSLAVTAALLASACSTETTDHPRPLGHPHGDAKPAAAGGGVAAPARALARTAEHQRRVHARRLAAARAWGLDATPLLPPAPPRTKPALATEPGYGTNDGGPGLPPVITRVPTGHRVIFLTIDDGYRKDPELLRMLRELDVPVSAFLADRVARDDYAYFRDLRDLGTTVNNHTLTHPDLRELPYAAQRAEICGQQRVLEREMGAAPRIFRPPYGNYNGDTLRAVRDCGIDLVPLWQQEAFPGRWTYSRADTAFHPGDIVLTHFEGPSEFGGTMADVLRTVLRKAGDEGFAVARLEDYV